MGSFSKAFGLIPIVPTSDLYLTSYEHGDEARFVRVFRDTWRRIPLRDRRRILRYWRTDEFVPAYGKMIHPRAKQHAMRAIQARAGSDAVPAGSYIPRIELLNGWLGKRVPNDVVHEADHCGGLAAAFARGFIIRVQAPVFALMSDDVAMDLIGHELAHVYQYASYTTDERDSMTEGEVEYEADEIVRCWGFEVESIDQWSVAQGRVKVHECRDFDEYFERAFGKGSRYEGVF